VKGVVGYYIGIITYMKSLSVKRYFRKCSWLLATMRSVRRKINDVRINRINRKYKRTIRPLYDVVVMKKKMEEIDDIIRNRLSDATFYVISQSNEKVGIFGYINCFLPHIAYAVSKGYVPVIDMQSHHYIYSSPDGSRENVWEMFFEQPCGIGLDDIVGKKVIRCSEDLWYHWLPNSCPMMSDEDILLWSRLYHRYIKPNQTLSVYMDDEVNQILKNADKTIAAIYRGTTYTKGQAKGHPIQPTMKMLADMVEKKMSENNCDMIYLASDEKSIVNYFNDRFENKVLINKRVFYDEVEDINYSNYNVDGSDITGNLFNRENNQYLIGAEYISSMNIVSKCKCLVAGACGGTTAVLYMNGLCFRDRYIFDLGKYGIDPLPNE